MEISFTINGKKRSFEIAPGDLLVDILRKNRFVGTKKGCSKGECGSCTILLDGVPSASCLLLAVKVEGQSVMTIESPEEDPVIQTVQDCFIENAGFQCGYCTPAMILTGKFILEKYDNSPTHDEVAHHLSGVLCRCTGYQKCIESILEAGRRLKG